MIGWLKKLLSGSQREAPKAQLAAVKSFDQKQWDEELLTKGTCPDCLSPESMRLGPAGVSANNCMCIACRHEWNLLLLNGVTILEDMARASEDRARTIYGWEKDTATPSRIDA